MTSASIYNAINWLSTIQFSILSAVCFAVSFIGVLISMTENKHVTYEEWRISREDILEKIKAGDDENMKHINELKEKIAEGNVYQRQSFEVQKDTNEQIKQLNDTNSKQWDAIKEIKFVVKTHEEDIEKLEGTISENKK